MTPSTRTPTALEVRAPRGDAAREMRTCRPTLRASGDGWSLLGADGELLHRGFGIHGRHQCLEAARALGLIAVFS